MTTDSPRLSVNELANYMVSSETARIGIIRRAREPKTYVVSRYGGVRIPIRKFLVDPNHDPEPLREAEKKLSLRASDLSNSAMRRGDAERSIEVLRRIQQMEEELASYRFASPPGRQGKLLIGGVEVSVRADLLVYGSARGRDEAGAAVLRMTKDDTSTRTSKERRKQMGQHVATLALMHVENLAPNGRVPSRRLCMSIDVQHGAVFTAPRYYTRRRKDLESACTFIAAVWDTVNDL